MEAITRDTLSGFTLFGGVDDDDLDRIARRLDLREFDPGTLLLERNEAPRELYVILFGKVRVELVDSSGQILNLTELGRGSVIGERAIITGQRRSSNVRAMTTVVAARLARADFEELLDRIPRLYANLCRILATQLGSWAHRHQREESEHRESITNIIGWQLLPEFGEFPGATSWVRQLNDRLKTLAAGRSHVLILGEPGTWKDLAARLIHFHSQNDRPVLFLDCAAPPPVLHETAPADAGVPESSTLLGLAQEAALFGHAPEGAAYARRVRRGMIELAAGGDMILRNVDSLTRPVQEELVEFLESGQFTRRGERKLRTAEVRIIATSGKPLSPLVEAGKFNPLLYRRLAGETVELTPLRERKKDVAVTARSLLKSLNAKHQKNVRRLSQDALNLLVDHDWPLNATELYQVVSRAVVVCNGDTIQPEDISLQEHPFGDGRLNLLTLPAVERLARDQRFPRRLRWVTVPLFLGITIATLSGSPTGSAANLAAWTVGWPGLVVVAFLFARGWCSFCPMEAIGESLGVTSRVVRDPAPWLKKWGPSVSLVALVFILLLEQASGMFSYPPATGLLLGGILLATVTADLVIGRRGWCKFLCPLGRIVSMISRISPLEMHSNRNVCLSRCRVDDCVKEKGCPMGLHPSAIDSSDHCVLCLDCVRSCPHHSMQLDLRNPAASLCHKSRRGVRDAFFSVILLGAVLAARGTPLLAGRKPEVFPHTLWSGADWLTAVAVIAGFTGLAVAASMGGGRSRWRAVFATCGLCYLPLATAGLFMIFFRAFVEGGARLVPLLLAAVGLDRVVDPAALTPELGTLRLVIYPMIVMAGLISWMVLGRLQRRDGVGEGSLRRHRLLMAAATAGLIAIV
ncbi:histidine kinase [Geomonas sp. Red276]